MFTTAVKILFIVTALHGSKAADATVWRQQLLEPGDAITQGIVEVVPIESAEQMTEAPQDDGRDQIVEVVQADGTSGLEMLQPAIEESGPQALVAQNSERGQGAADDASQDPVIIVIDGDNAKRNSGDSTGSQDPYSKSKRGSSLEDAVKKLADELRQQQHEYQANDKLKHQQHEYKAGSTHAISEAAEDSSDESSGRRYVRREDTNQVEAAKKRARERKEVQDEERRLEARRAQARRDFEKAAEEAQQEEQKKMRDRKMTRHRDDQHDAYTVSGGRNAASSGEKSTAATGGKVSNEEAAKVRQKKMKVSASLINAPGTCMDQAYSSGECHIQLSGNEVAVTGNVLVGSQGAPLKCIFDTGSKDFIIKNIEYDRKQEKIVHPYDHMNSSTYVNFHEKAAVGYGSGDAAVLVGSDDLKIGNNIVPQVLFGEIVAEKGLTIMHYGELGMHFPNIECIMGLMHMKKPLPHVKNEKSVFDRLRSNGVSNFGYCVKGVGDAEFIVNDHSSTGKEVEVVSDYHWAAELSQIGIGKPGEKALNMCADGSKCAAVLDTGTSIITGPREAVGNLIKALDVKTDCSNLDQLPDVTFKLHTHELRLSPAAYVVQVEMPVVEAQIFEATNVSLGKNFDAGRQLHCVPSFKAAEARLEGGGKLSGAPMWIFGEPFFQQYYTKFAWPGGGSSERLAAFRKKEVQPGIETPFHRQAFPMSSSASSASSSAENSPTEIEYIVEIPDEAMDSSSLIEREFSNPFNIFNRDNQGGKQEMSGQKESSSDDDSKDRGPVMHIMDATEKCPGATTNMKERYIVDKDENGKTSPSASSLIVKGQHGRPSWRPRVFKRPEDIRYRRFGLEDPIDSGLGVQSTGI